MKPYQTHIGLWADELKSWVPNTIVADRPFQWLGDVGHMGTGSPTQVMFDNAQRITNNQEEEQS